jgi:hypothetical protein
VVASECEIVAGDAEMGNSVRKPLNTDSTGQEFAVFKPRKPVLGWLCSLALVAVLATLMVFALHNNRRGDPSAWIAFGLILAFMIPATFFLLIFPTMKYLVGGDRVILSCGPFKWVIANHSIKSIREKDLGYIPISEGWKLPGYTLFKIRYGGVGTVRMCATSMTKRILLIETDTDLWGITPADADSFVASIRRVQG